MKNKNITTYKKNIYRKLLLTKYKNNNDTKATFFIKKLSTSSLQFSLFVNILYLHYKSKVYIDVLSNGRTVSDNLILTFAIQL